MLETPSTIFFHVLAANFIVLSIWSVFRWPYFINPLRHLPTVHVCALPYLADTTPRSKTSQGSFIGAEVFLRHPRGQVTVDWLRTISNEGLIHFRAGLKYSILRLGRSRVGLWVLWILGMGWTK